MTLKNFLELAARGGVVGMTVIMTNYIGVWGSVHNTEYLLKRVKAQTVKSYLLTKNDFLPNLNTRYDKMMQTYREGLKKTLDLVILTPDVVGNLVKTANNWTFETIFPKEIQFPDEHGKEEHDENQQLEITEDLPHVVQKALPQQEEEQCEAISAATFEENNDNENNDENDDMGPILSALAMTLMIIKTNSSLSDIRKKFNS